MRVGSNLIEFQEFTGLSNDASAAVATAWGGCSPALAVKREEKKTPQLNHTLDGSAAAAAG